MATHDHTQGSPAGLRCFPVIQEIDDKVPLVGPTIVPLVGATNVSAWAQAIQDHNADMFPGLFIAWVNSVYANRVVYSLINPNTPDANYTIWSPNVGPDMLTHLRFGLKLYARMQRTDHGNTKGRYKYAVVELSLLTATETSRLFSGFDMGGGDVHIIKRTWDALSLSAAERRKQALILTEKGHNSAFEGYMGANL